MAGATCRHRDRLRVAPRSRQDRRTHATDPISGAMASCRASGRSSASRRGTRWTSACVACRQRSATCRTAGRSHDLPRGTDGPQRGEEDRVESAPLVTTYGGRCDGARAAGGSAERRARRRSSDRPASCAGLDQRPAVAGSIELEDGTVDDVVRCPTPSRNQRLRPRGGAGSWRAADKWRRPGAGGR